MKYKVRNSVLILVLSMAVYTADGQKSQALYNMNIPQNHMLNPALRPTNSFYIGLPGLSGINMNVSNNFLNFSDVFINGGADSLLPFLHAGYNPDKFLAKIKERNSIEPNFTMPLFGLGFSVGKDTYVFLDINDHFEGNFVVPGDFFRLALADSKQFIGTRYDLSSLTGDMKYYRELGFGFSRNFTRKLRIGVTGKLYFGIVAASFDTKTFGLLIQDELHQTLDADITANFSAPLIVNISPDHKFESIDFDDNKLNTSQGVMDFVFNRRNMGMGFDLGATYDITQRLTVSAAITDIGYINWKSDISSLQVKSKFVFDGLNMDDVYNGQTSIESVTDEILDSLEKSYTIVESNSPFTTHLPYGMTLGGSFDVTKSFSVGLLSYSRVVGKQLKEALTLSANLNLGSSLSLSLAYTSANNRYDNLGAGLAFRAGFFQFYSVFDRIPLSWNRVRSSEGNSLILPANINTINARFGINFVFGNKIKKKAENTILVED